MPNHIGGHDSSKDDSNRGDEMNRQTC